MGAKRGSLGNLSTALARTRRHDGGDFGAARRGGTGARVDGGQRVNSRWARPASERQGRRRLDQGQEIAGGHVPITPPTPIFADWVPCGRFSPQPHKKIKSIL